METSEVAIIALVIINIVYDALRLWIEWSKLGHIKSGGIKSSVKRFFLRAKSPQHSLDALTAAEREEYEKDKKRYMKDYPDLFKEVVAHDLLHEALLIKVRIARLTPDSLDISIELRERIAINKLLNDLHRTFQVYLQRLGITWVGRKRRKDTKRRQVQID